MYFSQLLVLGSLFGALTSANPIHNPGNPLLSERIDCPTTIERQTQKVGDGNPHQNFIFKQVSGSTNCANNPEGSAQVESGQTVEWSLSISGEADFITGGFDIGESWSTGQSNAFGCETNSGISLPGSLCVFERIQTTAFTANSRQCTEGCGSVSCGDWANDVVISAPNSQQGSCFADNVQLNLPCGILGSEIPFNSGPAGGPQFVSCDTDVQQVWG